MKYLLTTIMMLVSLSLSMSSCGKDNNLEPMSEIENNTNGTTNATGSKMKIIVGAAVFTATLNDNQSANAFKAMLPLSIKMEDLNANEKFYNFTGTLPTNASVGGNIQVGDIMLYGNNCLVIFYKGFNTSFSYTRLGKIDNVTGLVAALGSGDVNVRFELQ
ncbi:cyclophilin-like fold protein [Pedobacter lithocola]|uniref:Cyclophilin-like fold protein n=1 Tax=Pedobacter lithocola TaxID=1908239 RepID=A0ABV8P7B5_9SPHI